MAALRMKRGDTAPFRGVAVVVATVEEPMDITTATVFFTAKSDIDHPDASAIIALDSDSNGIEITDAVNGEFVITIAPSDTDSITVDDELVLVYDVQLVFSPSEVYTVDEGTLTIEQDVTRRVA
jgi:hypothetical protein